MPTTQGISTSVEGRDTKLTVAAVCLALVILTGVVFWPVKNCNFVKMDDGIYVYENTVVQSGLTWEGILQAFSFNLAEKSANWHPVTWLSLMLDYQIFGLNPAAYHLMNLFFHIISAILLFGVLFRMTKTLWTSAFVAVLFAVHPLHVESVAWIAERKDVLSAFFWILSLGAYHYYVISPGWRRYSWVLLFFILGLMSKPMLVTLPFVLLLLDYWPLNRFQKMKAGLQAKSAVFKTVVSDKQKKKSRKPSAIQKTLATSEPTDSDIKWSLIFPLLREKIPLFVLVVLSCIITYAAQQQGGAVSTIEAVPWVVRIGNAFVSYATYIGQMIWPVNLAVFYPLEGLIFWQVLGSVLLLATATWGVLRLFKQAPYLATGWLWYLGTLVPVIGLVQVGNQARADRYTYIPLIGLFVMVAWGAPDLLKRWNWPYRKETLIIAATLIILCLSVVTWRQTEYWKNSISLFERTVQVTNDNKNLYNVLGSTYYSLGYNGQAISAYSKAIEIDPHFAEAYNNRGVAYKSLGDYRRALNDFRKAIEINADYADAYMNRAITNYLLRNYEQAFEDFNKAINIRPDHAQFYNNRGIAHKGQGQYRQAIADFEKAIEIRPDYAQARLNHYQIVDELRKEAKSGNKNVGNFLIQKGIAW